MSYKGPMTKAEWTRRRSIYMRKWRASLSPEKYAEWRASIAASRKKKKADKALGIVIDRRAGLTAAPDAPYQNHKKWVAKHPRVMSQKLKEERMRLKLDVLAAYGSVCACCGEDEQVFLTIDHIIPARRTKEQRKQPFHRQLRIEGYPPGYQVLCFNCNCAKRTNVECPHRLIVKRKLMLVEPRPM